VSLEEALAELRSGLGPSDNPAEDLATLARLSAIRAALDETERELIASARARGVSWTRLAAALGLRTRQAAEQRFLRLSDRSGEDSLPVRVQRQRQRSVDEMAGPAIVRLRTAVGRALRLLDGDPAWDTVDARARLVRATLHTAATAEPGALFSLVHKAIADLDEFTARVAEPAVRNALDKLRRAWSAANPA
jgi:hypothetical protein